MKIQKYLILLLILLHFSCKSQAKKINGLSFVASSEKINATHTALVVNVQSNYVALMPFGFIRELSSPKIIHNTNRQWFGETKNGLLQYAKEFQKHSIKIMVKPHIWVWNGHYTGLIDMDSEENWSVLEESYTAFILTYAKAAQGVHFKLSFLSRSLFKFGLH